MSGLCKSQVSLALLALLALSDLLALYGLVILQVAGSGGDGSVAPTGRFLQTTCPFLYDACVILCILTLP